MPLTVHLTGGDLKNVHFFQNPATLGEGNCTKVHVFWQFDPRLWFFDEYILGVAPHQRRKVWDLNPP